MVFHSIDEASLFHLGRRLDNRNLEHVIPAFSDMWLEWAGSPNQLYSDPAGEFVSDQWLSFLQGLNVTPKLSTEAWQKGRVERHGALVKEMLQRFDTEKTIQTPQELDTVLRACFQAKNSMMKYRSFSPKQIVLGTATRVPASLTSDESSSAHSLATGHDLESERFRRQLEIRNTARKAFLISDNSQAIRRALLRRSCPVRGPYQVGQMVMYWRRQPKANRREGGRWHGPAKIVAQESSSTIWVAHAHRVLRCSPESLRPASLREWQGSQQPLESMIDQQRKNDEGITHDHQEHHQPVELEYSPGTPVPTEGQPPSPHTSLQPESELFPDVPHNHSQSISSETDNLTPSPIPEISADDPGVMGETPMSP